MCIRDSIYASGDKLRMEAKMAGMNTINIVRKDQSKIYTIMVDQKIYMEMPFSMDKRSPDDVLRDVNAKWEDLGADTVNGIACQKYKIVSADKGAFFWLSKDKKQPVRMQTEDGKVTVDWKSFVAGPQDDKLFEVPAGFTKMDMPNIDPSMMDPSKMPKIPTGE